MRMGCFPVKRWLSSEQFAAGVSKGEPVDDAGVRLAAIVEVTPGEERRLTFTISTENPDRERDVIDVRGWDLGPYSRNGVVTWAHDYTAPPIARATRVWIEGASLKAIAEFVPKDVYPFADMVYQLYRQGFLSATSVGFRPLEWNYNEERKGIDFKRQELLEFACVPVPANAECLVEARAAGIDVGPLREWATKVLDRLGPEEQIVRTRLGDVLIPEVRIEGTADGVRRFWSFGQLTAPTPLAFNVSPDLTVTSSSGTPGTLNVASTMKPEMVHPDDNGTCPSGYAMGDDGMCHEKAAGTHLSGYEVGDDEMCRETVSDVVKGVRDAIAKRGRVLSSANEGRLREAAEAAQAADAKIREVVAQVEAAPEAPEAEPIDRPTELTVNSELTALPDNPSIPKTVDVVDAEGVPPSVEAVSVSRDIGALGDERAHLVTRLHEIDSVLGLSPYAHDAVIDLDAIPYDDPDDVLMGLTEVDVRATLTAVALDLRRGVIEGLGRQLAVARGRVD